ncbi:MAG TPA: hypothetical protein QF480_03750 [Bacteroidales bacterium]|jgi:hypothetical protein|nr:hypothetical protein [Bacteroidales bacterium]|tara:strand:- start:188 stop:604 length:417 start_codon:yes stop_codon:yes gene_type:complete
MKSKDVPQDDANMLQGKFKEPVYSLDEEGNYITVPSVGWDPKNAVMQEAWDIVNEKVEKARQYVLSGKLSPIGYYIEKNIMDIGLVAKYMGVRKWKVKKHLAPKNFAKLNDEMLEKYAKVFSISKEELVNIKLLSNVG